MLNASHKVESYKEGSKEDLERDTSNTISLDLPYVLDPNTVYIGTVGDGTAAGSEYEAGQDVTKAKDKIHGLTVLIKDDISAEDTSGTIVIMAHQPIKIDRKESMW
jgi:hypothetical protein